MSSRRAAGDERFPPNARDGRRFDFARFLNFRGLLRGMPASLLPVTGHVAAPTFGNRRWTTVFPPGVLTKTFLNECDLYLPATILCSVPQSEYMSRELVDEYSKGTVNGL